MICDTHSCVSLFALWTLGLSHRWLKVWCPPGWEKTLLRDRNTMDSLETLSPQFLYRKTFFPAEIPLLISMQF